jgi:signal transduction histidine kinase
VLANILANGVEANAGRRVRFVIRVSCAASVARIAICNDGVPVRSDVAARIFEPYISSKAGRDHMGLGLAIVKKIAVEHGGEISYTEDGGKPCFTLSLARAHADGSMRAPA